MDFQQLLNDISQQFQSQSLLDWAITVTALAYVFLAAKEYAVCWVFGIVSSGLWAWADFFRYNLWVDGLLQIFYVVMGFAGLYAWLFAPQKTGEKVAVHTLPLRQQAYLIALGLALTVMLGFLFKQYTPTSFPYADAFITAFSIIATFLTIKKVLESWLYWIVFDALAVALFWAKDAVLVALVMVVYTLMAVYGWRQWRAGVAAAS
ncbi:MAG: nicotinamide mononucleotide transporter [Saprospiraceae bacterium]|nr:nicotinamide mononucleotide transporter [Saprospiraceae bacterium]